jgi:hypothetical protein
MEDVKTQINLESSHMRLVLLLTLLACQSSSPPRGVEPGKGNPGLTGFEGTALLGPTRPVCPVDKPCEAPFEAGFDIWQGDRVVTRFRSDSAGRFRVQVPPGIYTVTADSSAGILIRSQAQQVTVEPGRLTQVEWHFDTGVQ